MRKALLLCFMITLLENAASAQLKLGIQAGLNFSNLSAVKTNQALRSSFRVGYHAGLQVDAEVMRRFYVQTGLLFITKGYTRGDVVNIEAEAYYIELPVHFVYKSQLGEGKLLLGAGPYLGYGLGGKWRLPSYNEGRFNLPAMNGNLEFANDAGSNNYYSVYPGSTFTYGKPFDFGADILVGYEFFKKLSFRLNGQIGLANIAPKVEGSATADKLRNFGFGFSIGYLF